MFYKILFVCSIALLAFTENVSAQCPYFQTGAVGSDQANRTVVFYDINGDTVAICECQLTGNEMKCHTCKPDEENYYYYEVFINGVLEICYSSTTLGVELKDYSATYDGSQVKCHWTTLSEQNNSHFYWQKSPDGKVTWNLEDIPGAGTTNKRSTYTFEDFDPMREWAYYRLVQVDQDGKETVYSWIYVYKEELKSTSLRLIPNPTRGSFVFYLPYEWEHAMVTIINIAGQEVYQKQFSSGSNSIVAPIKPGRYTVQVKSEQGCSYSTLIVY